VNIHRCAEEKLILECCRKNSVTLLRFTHHSAPSGTGPCPCRPPLRCPSQCWGLRWPRHYHCPPHHPWGEPWTQSWSTTTHQPGARTNVRTEWGVRSTLLATHPPTHPPPFTFGCKWPPTHRRYELPALPPPSDRQCDTKENCSRYKIAGNRSAGSWGPCACREKTTLPTKLRAGEQRAPHHVSQTGNCGQPQLCMCREMHCGHLHSPLLSRHNDAPSGKGGHSKQHRSEHSGHHIHGERTCRCDTVEHSGAGDQARARYKAQR
jgi:hypothetical protein